MQALWLLSLCYAVAAVAHPVYSSGNLEKRAISEEVFDDFFFYCKYASSADDLYCAYPNGNTLIEEFSNSTTDTQGFIARDDTRREIVVSLRGSTSVEDFAIDSETSLEPYVSPGVVPPPGAMTHTGFLTAWNSVAPGVISVVREQLLEHPGYAIVTTGHSLGGALSSLAGVSMKSNFPVNPVRMYTYGQPRTGNPTYAYFVNDLFGPNAYRFVHAADGVPTEISQAEGYRHHGIEYWQNPDPPSAANTKERAADGEDPTCSDSIPSTGINIDHVFYFGVMVGTPFCTQ
ncbi:alpha/beta-hydrolase [Gloeophyllum trabeum ATCC 11539]|uniref:Alpha/beta-hydrolase n=1 Tax=Gloeophyllum trabeum (strain ATCC 11539 / FP-39264 / Madison 617) TaxID=670483 RepID=S7Q9V5_GLOTA|nr:alpha/beta-hydrolase [Gloeophyllum trabeum ATCC 11539]EPQ56302.1 alpha/beta-hydrolase [Gloeophyllum trabeum ATCC 11539]